MRPFSRVKSAVCSATTLSFDPLRVSWSLKPAVRSTVTLTPDAPSRMATFPESPVALIMASAARSPWVTKFEPIQPM